MKRGAVAGVLASLALAATSAGAREGFARVTVLDDGEKIARDARRPLAPSPWTAPDGAVELFALRGEIVALQVVVEAGDRAEDDVHVTMGALCTEAGACLDAGVEAFVARFIDVRRPTGSDRDGDSLAFTAASAPPLRAFTGAVADALVPSTAAGDVRVEAGERGVIWLDLSIPAAAVAGVYRGALLVRSASGELAARPLWLRVLDATLPYAAAKVTVYYEGSTLVRRMGEAAAPRAESELRALLHAHHLSAIHDVTSAAAAARDVGMLRGEAFTPERGYRGPGEGTGEGVFAIGAYGSLGAPTAASVAVAEEVAIVLRDAGLLATTQTFIYAIDEQCESPWPAEWRALARRRAALEGVRVGATCGVNPTAQAASLVMMTAPDLFPQRARLARAAPSGKWVWAYNGQRPYAGPMMLDVPATDLRANAWIAARYGIERWFYWEATYWLDSNAGGQGGGVGTDPFVVAESFHNEVGDHANGDGILVYPGTQRLAGAVDYGLATVFPSVRLKNLRRGIEDAGYVALARAVDREAADDVVRRTVPRALALAGDRPAWPERGAAWISARSALADVIASRTHRSGAASPAGVPPDHVDVSGVSTRPMSEGCGIARHADSAGAVSATLLLLILGGVRRGRRTVRLWSMRTRGVSVRMNRKRYEASQTPTLRIAAVRERTATAKKLAREQPASARPVPSDPPPHVEGRISGLRPRKRGSIPAVAIVDEVTADLSKDPRHDAD